MHEIALPGEDEPPVGHVEDGGKGVPPERAQRVGLGEPLGVDGHEQQEEEEAKYAQHRKSQIGKGDRNEKIRTYNFPDNRLTDHRVRYTAHNLAYVMEGDLDEIFDVLGTHALEEKLKELEGDTP